MLKKAAIYILVCTGIASCKQPNSYNEHMAAYRQEYKTGFLHNNRSPLTAADTGYLRFFAPDESYKVLATVQLTPDAIPFEMPTVNGESKTYKQYAVLSMNINDTLVKLVAYQSQKLLNDPENKNHLFVPFTDGTTYTETYGGGRYLDLSTTDIKNSTIEVDFNKCYNPWCAFAEGYSCPIPPVENRLAVSIRAGEKMYAKEVPH
jgi:uncharacterized protein (DUF1684 family)